jgi:hypothetical protein
MEVLDAEIRPAFEELDDPSYIFMQDNTSIHPAHKVRDWFRDAGITVLDWPAYSPDLNPIEHVWKKPKEIVDLHFPEISRSTGESEANLEHLGSTIQACWDMIPKEFFDILYQSMSSRMEACYKAKG